ncbi:F-box/LRR-repeat protein At3g48880 [Morus notabilis]|uniref:F-box/LRR-repeat protein At3g48880 n=1 Tax=Morus notabilis TaxID=981085 RepID=UPI000CED18D1|nr:F-box/LRR-repeat protein At3g48880 [Morus notabilis]
MVDLVTGASQVCSQWRSTCRDPVFWSTVDLNQIHSRRSATTAPVDRRVWTVERCSLILMMILNKALNLGGENLNTLFFHLFMLLRSDFLLCAAKRSPNLRRLILPARHQIDGEGFEEAIKHWKHLESLTLPCSYYPANMIGAIGTHCKNFVELRLICPVDYDLANDIVTLLPQLKFLIVPCSKISRQALVHLLLDTNLEVLNLSYSTLVDDYIFYEIDDDIFDPFAIEREIYPLASQLRMFVPWARVAYHW